MGEERQLCKERALVCLWKKLPSHVSYCVLLRRTTEVFHPKQEMMFLCSGHSYCTEIPSPGHGSLSGDGLQSPRKPLLHQENICVLQLDVAWVFFSFLLPRICSSLWLQYCLNGGALPKVSSVKYCFTITSAEVNEHCQESTMNTVFRY